MISIEPSSHHAHDLLGGWRQLQARYPDSLWRLKQAFRRSSRPSAGHLSGRQPEAGRAAPTSPAGQVKRGRSAAEIAAVDVESIETILAASEQALAAGGPVDLRGLGFWRAVADVKRRPAWVERFADRIAAIDRQAFEQAVRPTFPPALGSLVLSVGALAGLLLAAASYTAPPRWKGLAVLAAAGLLLGTTHGLAHLVVGRAVGVRFTHWFFDGPARLQPGLKVDYASYLRTPARARAWMHASGALVTKAIPFALLALTARAGGPAWATGALVAIGCLQIATDLLFSTRFSDWKRFRRELRSAGAAGP